MEDLTILFDEQFAVSEFEALIEKSENESESILSSTRQAIHNAYERKSDDPKYVLDISDDVAEKIDSGELQLVTYGDEVYAQLLLRVGGNDTDPHHCGQAAGGEVQGQDHRRS